MKDKPLNSQELQQFQSLSRRVDNQLKNIEMLLDIGWVLNREIVYLLRDWMAQDDLVTINLQKIVLLPEFNTDITRNINIDIPAYILTVDFDDEDSPETDKAYEDLQRIKTEIQQRLDLDWVEDKDSDTNQNKE